MIIVLSVAGYQAWRRYDRSRRKAEVRQWASLTTTIWEGAARYHDNPEGFLAFRDSVLTAHNRTLADMQAYLKKNQDSPEDYLAYARQVHFLMDSLEQQRLKKESIKAHTADSSAAKAIIPRP